MRLSAVLLIGSLLGIVGGAALIGTVAIGVAIIFDSLLVGVYALARDDGQPAVASVREVRHSLNELFDRVRDAA